MKAVRNARVRASLQGAIRPREARLGGVEAEAAEDQTERTSIRRMLRRTSRLQLPKPVYSG